MENLRKKTESKRSMLTKMKATIDSDRNTTLLQEIKESLLKSTRTKLIIISKKNRILIAEKQGKSVN